MLVAMMTGCGSAGPVEAAKTAPQQPESKAVPPQRERQRKHGYKEQRELETLPEHIESLEREQAEIHTQLANPALYRQGGEEIVTVQQRLQDIERELAQSYERWEVLEALPH